MKPKPFFTSPATLLCCLLGTLLGAGGFTFREGEGLAYLGNESKTCANCHIMRDQYDGWQKASHHAHATCNDCHVPHGFVRPSPGRRSSRSSRWTRAPSIPRSGARTTRASTTATAAPWTPSARATAAATPSRSLTPTWEGAPRLLFVMKAMYGFTGHATWQRRYLNAASEKVGKAQRPRIDICREGMVFDPGQGPRHSWTGSEGVICLRALWEMESDATLKAAYAEGLRHSAELSEKSLPLTAQFDVNGTEVFNVDWRVMNGAWKPQNSEQEAVEVALAGLKLQHQASPRMHMEKDYLREPCFAAWVVTLCPDRDFVMSRRSAIEKVITHYDFRRAFLSQFFPVESAWWRIKLLEPAKIKMN